MLKLRSHGTNDYSVLEGGRRIGRIRFVIERMPGVWLWNVTVHLITASSKELPEPKAALSPRATNLRVGSHP